MEVEGRAELIAFVICFEKRRCTHLLTVEEVRYDVGDVVQLNTN